MAFEIERGRIVGGGLDLAIPNYRLLRVLGVGANGVACLATNEFLGARRVVKIWTTLRAGDSRNKFRQGIEEAKKAFRAKSERIVEIFDAGAVDSIFYCVMQYFEGLTCRKWLRNHAPSLLARLLLAKDLMELNSRLSERGLLHGDLHWNNILIAPDATACESGEIHLPQFLVIDFGTSFFTKNADRTKRHWKVLFETVDKLLSPIKLKRIFSHDFPHGDTPNNVSKWYSEKIEQIPRLLISFGVQWLLPPPFWDDIDNGTESWPIDYPDRRAYSNFEAMCNAGGLTLTPKGIGFDPLWYKAPSPLVDRTPKAPTWSSGWR